MWYFFTQFVPDHLVYLLEGAVVTLELCFVSMALGIAIGVVSAILAIAGGRVMKGFVRIYVSICRGVPLIVILLFIYFTLPDLGLRLPAFWAGVLGLSVNLGAYLSEVFRAAILAVDQGQTQAGLSLGLRRIQIYRKIILPQAAIIAVPTVGGYFISLLKDCALVSFISVDELLRLRHLHHLGHLPQHGDLYAGGRHLLRHERGRRPSHPQSRDAVASRLSQGVRSRCHA